MDAKPLPPARVTLTVVSHSLTAGQLRRRAQAALRESGLELAPPPAATALPKAISEAPATPAPVREEPDFADLNAVSARIQERVKKTGRRRVTEREIEEAVTRVRTEQAAPHK